MHELLQLLELFRTKVLDDLLSLVVVFAVYDFKNEVFLLRQKSKVIQDSECLCIEFVENTRYLEFFPFALWQCLSMFLKFSHVRVIDLANNQLFEP